MLAGGPLLCRSCAGATHRNCTDTAHWHCLGTPRNCIVTTQSSAAFGLEQLPEHQAGYLIPENVLAMRDALHRYGRYPIRVEGEA